MQYYIHSASSAQADLKDNKRNNNTSTGKYFSSDILIKLLISSTGIIQGKW